jgi:hypothetical protein
MPGDVHCGPGASLGGRCCVPHGPQRGHRALQWPRQRHACRRVGGQLSVVDQLGQTLDQVGRPFAAGLGQPA